MKSLSLLSQAGLGSALVAGLLISGCGGSNSTTGPTPQVCSGALINAVVANNSSCVAQFLAAQNAPATGDGFDPISPLAAAAAMGETSIVGLLLPKYMVHIDLAVVAAAGGRPSSQQKTDTIELLSKSTLSTYAGFQTLNFALGIAVIRNQNAVISWLQGRGINSVPPAFNLTLNNPMNGIDRQLSALGAP